MPPLDPSIFQFLSLHRNYLTTEKSIFSKFLESLQNHQLIDQAINVSQMEAQLEKAKDQGWLIDIPDTHLVQINPLFSLSLSKHQVLPSSKLSIAFLDYYSAYCNYLIDVYLNSTNKDLKVEGIKVIFYEYHNFVRAVEIAIHQQEDFLHLFHLLDTALEFNEEHEERLFLVEKSLVLLEQLPQLREEIAIQKIELGSFKGDIYYRLGKRALAVKQYETALNFLENKKLSTSAAMVYNNLANLFADEHQLQKAITYYQQAIELLL